MSPVDGHRFHRVRLSFQGDDGDLPLLELDYLNAPLNRYTGMEWGESDRLWYGWLNEEKSEPERAEKVPCQKRSCFFFFFLSDACHLTVGSSITSSIISEPLISREFRSI